MLTRNQVIRAAQNIQANDPDQAMFNEFAAKTISDAIRDAARSRDLNGAKYSHQTRVSNRALIDASLILTQKRNQNLIKNINDFDVLHDTIATLTSQVDGFGKLCIYDTALRIGAKLNVWPTEIYLHAGVGTGLQKLNNDFNLGIANRLPPHIPITSLPA